MTSYKKYDFFKFEEEAMDCLRNKRDISLANNSDIKKLVFNEKHSLFGKIFVSAFAVLMVTLIFIKIK